MVTKTQAIKNFLLANTVPDLADLYNYNMEVQVNVAQDEGKKISGEFNGKIWYGWTDDLTVWKSFRVPFNANIAPEYTDTNMSWDLATHAIGIGMTGWDWKNRVSRWVAFDFDSIIGHGAGLSPGDMSDVIMRAKEIPYVTVRRSTGGNGIHLYIFFADPPSTDTHTHHAALARAILSQLSIKANFDFINKVDVCGGNMWVWHRKQKGTKGLELLKVGKLLQDIPPNWKDHIKVTSGRKSKATPAIVENEAITSPTLEEEFELLTGQYVKTPLSDQHMLLINWLETNKAVYWWDQETHMLVTHTVHLRDAHKALALRGIFNTVSTGKEIGHDHNCFLFPLHGGGWVVRRFTKGVKEEKTWTADAGGWTRCQFNCDPTLISASLANNGTETSKGGFYFNTAEQGIKTIEQLGGSIDVHPGLTYRPMEIKKTKDNRLIVMITREASDNPINLEGWTEEGKKWVKVLGTRVKDSAEEVRNYDSVVRHTVQSSVDAGWALNVGGRWIDEPLTHIRSVLRTHEQNPKDVERVIGDAVSRPWTLINTPFAPEYPGGREWNRGACQLCHVPSQLDTEQLHYPTWTALLNHVGASLDPYIEELLWCKEWGITCGGDYLLCWISCLIKKPKQPTPFLFLYGPESCGKSALHEAISLLFTPNGYIRAENSLLNSPGFNGELQYAVLCAVEEVDLRANGSVALSRIKDWVVAPKISLHIKTRTPFMIDNTTHWIQCANNMSFCPVFPGDTRITVIRVNDLLQDKWLSKHELMTRLSKEAPDFLAKVLRFDIKEPIDRHAVPVILTGDKATIQESNTNSLTAFAESTCYYVTGEMVLLADFYQKYIESLEPSEQAESKRNIAKLLPSKFVVGRGSSAKHFIGNMSFSPAPEGHNKPELIKIGDFLRPRNDTVSKST